MEIPGSEFVKKIAKFRQESTRIQKERSSDRVLQVLAETRETQIIGQQRAQARSIERRLNEAERVAKLGEVREQLAGITYKK